MKDINMEKFIKKLYMLLGNKYGANIKIKNICLKN